MTTDATRLRSHLDTLVAAGYPGALGSVTTAGGESSFAVAGDPAPPLDGEVRVASNTKTYVAVVVLQLVEEGLVALNAPVGDYLPGLVRGEGIDDAAITVRRLLQQTSGLPEYADRLAADAHDRTLSPHDLLALAFERPAMSAPGERWAYCNTNYVLLGLLIEQVTGRTLSEQIHDRIVEPLGLQHTYFPDAGERALRGNSPRSFHGDAPGALRDVSALDPSFAGAAGAMVASPSDLDRFLQALLGGRILSADSLAEMQRTVPAGDFLWPEAGYGLGLKSIPLSSGGTAWGHGGDIPGTQTRNAVGPDGTAATIVVTALPSAVVDPTDVERLMQQYRIVADALDRVLCGETAARS
jgi:D-alanyl-D-alanine carboxypeptidase